MMYTCCLLRPSSLRRWLSCDEVANAFLNRLFIICSLSNPVPGPTLGLPPLPLHVHPEHEVAFLVPGEGGRDDAEAARGEHQALADLPQVDEGVGASVLQGGKWIKY